MNPVLLGSIEAQNYTKDMAQNGNDPFFHVDQVNTHLMLDKDDLRDYIRHKYQIFIHYNTHAISRIFQNISHLSQTLSHHSFGKDHSLEKLW